MERLDYANQKADETKQLMENTVGKMSQNVTKVESNLVPDAVDLACAAQETKELA